MSRPINTQFRLNRKSPLAKGLVLWLPITDRGYRDYIRNRVFTPINTPTWEINGRFGRVIDFDRGSSEYLLNNTPAVLDEPLTIACWFNSRDTANFQFLVALSSVTFGARQTEKWGILAQGAVGGDPVRALAFGETDDSFVDSTSGYSANTWHHACGVFTSETSRAAYIDGRNKGTDLADTGAVLAENVSVGCAYAEHGAGPQPYGLVDGLVSGICIWNRALTDAEVFYAYQNPWELCQPLIPIFHVVMPGVAVAADVSNPPRIQPMRIWQGAR